DTNDTFVVKLGPDLDHLASASFPDASTDQSYNEVAVDSAGNVVVAGDFEGSIDFGGGPPAGAGDHGRFLAKVGPQLKHLQSKSFGDAESQRAADVAVDGAGNIVLIGNFTGSIDLGGGPLTSAGGSDIFVAKFDPELKHLQSKSFGDAADQTARSVAFD